jgi:hypothetical protein
MDLLVGWLPATPILVLLGVLTLGYGVLMGALALAVACLA